MSTSFIVGAGVSGIFATLSNSLQRFPVDHVNGRGRQGREPHRG